jgi:hypothetical protein
MIHQPAGFPGCSSFQLGRGYFSVVLFLTNDCEWHVFLVSPKADRITILAAYQGQVAEIESRLMKYEVLDAVQVTEFYLIMHMVGQVPPLSSYRKVGTGTYLLFPESGAF